MMTHLDDETLSALIDGEAGAAASDARAHAASCAGCASRLETLRAASAAFRRTSRALPADLAARAKAEAKNAAGTSRPFARGLAIAAASIAIIVATGILVKRTMPGLFSQIESSITGAASGISGGSGAP